MRRYDMALFDLDGTLSESGEGILLCVRKIFEEMERPLPDERTLGTFIGPPMYDSLRMCGFSHEDAEKGVEIYKRNFLESGIYMNRLYPGMMEVLVSLKKNGVRLGVATTKYYPFAQRIIGMLGTAELFDFVGGATAGTERRTKIGVIEYTLENLGCADRSRTVMIGDTKYDAEGAALAGLDFIGCLYGYGTRGEMADFCPDAEYVSEAAQIEGIILAQG